MVKKNLLEQAASALYYVAENGDPKIFYLERYRELAEQLMEVSKIPMEEEPVLLPSVLIKRIRRFVRDNPQLGFEDEREFIRSAVRTQMLEFKADPIFKAKFQP